jgi:hypothetical protein
VLAVDGELRAVQRPGKAQQDEGTVAEPDEVTAAGRDEALQLGRGSGGRLAATAVVRAVDAAQRGADGRMAGRPGELAQTMAWPTAARRRSRAERL